MRSSFRIYRYFKGEGANPFNPERQNAAHQFWEYERIFEEKFNARNYAPAVWTNHEVNRQEWTDVLAMVPIDKTELFKLWLYELLMEYLPGKYETNDVYFNRLYWTTIPQ